MFFKKALAILAFGFSVAAPMAATAMSVSPVLIDMTSTGKNAKGEINVANTGIADLPVALTYDELILNEDGTTERIARDDLFTIFPMQSVIKPNSTQRFRLVWVGGELEKSRTFVFTVAQIPVTFAEGESGIQIVYNFEAIVNVAPSGGKPLLKVLNSHFETVEGKRRAVLDMENVAATHGYLSGTKLSLQAKDSAGKVIWSRNYEPDQIYQQVGMGLIQPGAKRKFTLPFDLPEGGETLSATIKYIGRK